MTEKSHFAALQEIRRWNTNDVISALKNNGLEGCVDTFKRREITGEKLLELSEVTLGLWKRDLTICNIRKLASLVRDMSKSPAKYIVCNSYSDDAWDTDFDDDLEDENNHKTEHNVSYNSNSGKTIHHEKKSRSNSQKKGISEVKSSLMKNFQTDNGDLTNTVQKSNSLYLRRKISIPSVFVNETSSAMTEPLGNSIKSASMKDVSQSKKELQPEINKPSIPSRPVSLYLKSSSTDSKSLTLPKPPAFDNEGSVLREICEKLTFESDNMDEYESIDDELLLARNSDNHSNGFGGSELVIQQNGKENPSRSRIKNDNSILETTEKSESTSDNSKSISCFNTGDKINGSSDVSSGGPQCLLRHEEEQSIVNKDFVTDSCRKSPECLSQRNEIKREPSPNFRKQSNSPKPLQREREEMNSSSLSLNQQMGACPERYLEAMKVNEELNITTEEVYEIIPEDVRLCSSKVNGSENQSQMNTSQTPPMLPPKPKHPMSDIKFPAKSKKSEINATPANFWSFGNSKEKSLPKEKSTQDAKRNNTLPKPRPSGITHNYVNDPPRPSATRPLPPPPLDGGVQRPVKIPLVQMPWYFNIDRKKAEEMLRNCEDGTFVIRPSTQNPLTLTLKYGNRSFNICVRHRPDGRYALGTAKPTEQTFSSVEELVNHYTSNELLLYSNGMQAGTVALTSPPRKDQ